MPEITGVQLTFTEHVLWTISLHVDCHRVHFTDKKDGPSVKLRVVPCDTATYVGCRAPTQQPAPKPVSFTIL